MNKYNFKFALKIFAKNLVSKLFCFLLFFTFFMAVRGKIGSIITQVLDLVILTVIIFSTAFDFGEKDRNRVLTGAAEKDLSRGFNPPRSIQAKMTGVEYVDCHQRVKG